MSYQDINLGRLRAHLDILRQQEEDAYLELSRRGVQPWIQEQLKRLIVRLVDERVAIEAALGERSQENRQAC